MRVFLKDILAKRGVDLKQRVKVAMVDQGGDMAAACRDGGIENPICKAHQLNSTTGKVIKHESVDPIVKTGRVTVKGHRKSPMLKKVLGCVSKAAGELVASVVPMTYTG
uniref:Uncharacterized protein n=1 Tax=Chromera velia CCMP2878 TaxID=1169474 RepID=A0A0G4HQQ0_9ALVE|eukprot:Cvel_30424.t1-p1 / transcript=Cvel_30424.t1 / gene=Cvel_30424 / organism=Chromera_velia_CCMP2878 / gene_product=hypothetical protein / transcript_product=hypothetical protein / location=Cvel_scaffold4335:6622-7112(+) / protein_length=108 / sequence_SO=supercontig / SO=protein_coding / is_pseudo=false